MSLLHMRRSSFMQMNHSSQQKLPYWVLTKTLPSSNARICCIINWKVISRLHLESEMRTFIRTRSFVCHLKRDLSIPDSILFRDVNAMTTTDGSSYSLIASSATQNCYLFTNNEQMCEHAYKDGILVWYIESIYRGCMALWTDLKTSSHFFVFHQTES